MVSYLEAMIFFVQKKGKDGLKMNGFFLIRGLIFNLADTFLMLEQNISERLF